MSRVGFIGTGHIAAPMARALARNGHKVTVSERNAEVAAELAASGLGIEVASNQAVIDASDTVFLCLRPAIRADVLAPLTFRADQAVISVMAGVALADIAAACAPVTRISATIPYGFIENGGCPLPVAGDPAPLQALFGSDNPVLPQAEEAFLRHHFAASTLASALLGLLETGTNWLADKTGDPKGAEVYVANLAAGLLRDMDRSDAGHLAAEKAALATPNTLNLQMVEGLARARAFDALPALLDQIFASMETGL